MHYGVELTPSSVSVLLLGGIPPNNPIFIKENDAMEIRVKGTTHMLKWYALLPKPLDYDNTDVCAPDSGPECRVPIEWYWKEITDFRGHTSVHTNEHQQYFQAGTHRLAVVSDELQLPNPKPEHTTEIVVRRDDTYVGYATELIGTPFVFWPKQIEEGHQTDLRLAADCIATVIYGKRRMGHQIGYVAPKAVLRYLVEVEPTAVQVGDVLHFGFQTALLSQDTEPLGVLNDSDVILHSYHQMVEEVQFEQALYSGQPFKVYRWLDVFQ